MPPKIQLILAISKITFLFILRKHCYNTSIIIFSSIFLFLSKKQSVMFYSIGPWSKKFCALRKKKWSWFSKNLDFELFRLREKKAVVVAQLVAHQTSDREVLSLIPAGSWSFSLLFSFQSLNQWRVLNQVPILLVFNFSRNKNVGLAVQLEAEQAGRHRRSKNMLQENIPGILLSHEC